MTTAPVVHSSFSVERELPHPPERVFAAFADPEVKSAWFHGPDDWKPTETEFDFREGGREVAAGEVPGEWSSRFEATYHVIQPDTRIVYTYVMHHRDVRLSVSVATIELEPIGDGTSTRLTMTEQGAFLEGGVRGEEASVERERGTNWLLDQLAASL